MESTLSTHCPAPHYVREYTLVFLQSGGRILLGYKKRGFGQGKWNGFGGKVEPGESPVEAAARELREECGLVVASAGDLELQARMLFQFEDEAKIFRVHIYGGTSWSGTLSESDEMLPRWFQLGDVPYADMWPDDAYWLPEVLSSGCRAVVIGYFLYASDKATVLHHCLRRLLPGSEADTEAEEEVGIVSNVGQLQCVCGAGLAPLPAEIT